MSLVIGKHDAICTFSVHRRLSLSLCADQLQSRTAACGGCIYLFYICQAGGGAGSWPRVGVDSLVSASAAPVLLEHSDPAPVYAGSRNASDAPDPRDAQRGTGSARRALPGGRRLNVPHGPRQEPTACQRPGNSRSALYQMGSMLCRQHGSEVCHCDRNIRSSMGLACPTCDNSRQCFVQVPSWSTAFQVRKHRNISKCSGRLWVRHLPAVLYLCADVVAALCRIASAKPVISIDHA